MVRLLLAVLLLGDPSPPEGVLSGTLRANGVPIPQIVFSIQGPGGPLTVVSGPGGRFRTSLPPGDYTVSVRVPGFVLNPEPRVHLEAETVTLDLNLEPAPVAEHVVVAATRGEAAASEVGTSTSVIGRDTITDRDATSAIDLLPLVAGVDAARTGGVGAQASVFLRGGESDYARVLIDGVPVNEPGGYYNFGSLMPLELDHIEVDRGATSSLYGTDALAGVVSFVSRSAGPDARTEFHGEAEGGSFAWRRALLGGSGRSGSFDWNGGVERVETDNQGPNAALREWAAALSLGARLAEDTSLRLVARGETSTVGTPGQTAFQRPDLDANYEWKDLTLSAQLQKNGDKATQRLRFGYALTDQLSRDPLDSGNYVPQYGSLVGAFELSDYVEPLGYQNNTRRFTAGYEAELRAGSRQLLGMGADLEYEWGTIGSLDTGPLITPNRTNWGFYVQDRAVLSEKVYATIGGRVERNGSFGTRAVPRLAFVYRPFLGRDSTTIHASAGLGIKEPSFDESYGTSYYALGNPSLLPERSETVDLGIEQRLVEDRLRLDVTGYFSEYFDQIAFVTLDPSTGQGSYTNLGKTRARGVEVTLEAAPSSHFTVAAAYTFLDGTILETGDTFDPVYAQGQPLLRRPQNQASIRAHAQGGRVSGGVSVLYVGNRADSDFEGLGLTSSPAYTRVDAQLRVRLGGGFEAFVAGDNILNAQYMDVLGYPALGHSFRAGLRYRSAGDR
jgi:outer membrane cobalamin receptor